MKAKGVARTAERILQLLRLHTRQEQVAVLLSVRDRVVRDIAAEEGVSKRTMESMLEADQRRRAN